MTPNTFVELEDCIEMTCFDRYGYAKPDKVYFDKADDALVKQHQWCLHMEGKTSYCVTRTGKKILKLHQLLLPTIKSMTVDHLDRNGCNNRRSNLRTATKHEQQVNRGMPCNNTSGIKGVAWRQDRNKWRAHIGVNGKFISLGYYTTLEAAAQARSQAEAKYFAPVPVLDAMTPKPTKPVSYGDYSDLLPK